VNKKAMPRVAKTAVLSQIEYEYQLTADVLKSPAVERIAYVMPRLLHRLDTIIYVRLERIQLPHPLRKDQGESYARRIAKND